MGELRGGLREQQGEEEKAAQEGTEKRAQNWSQPGEQILRVIVVVILGSGPDASGNSAAKNLAPGLCHRAEIEETVMARGSERDYASGVEPRALARAVGADARDWARSGGWLPVRAAALMQHHRGGGPAREVATPKRGTGQIVQPLLARLSSDQLSGERAKSLVERCGAAPESAEEDFAIRQPRDPVSDPDSSSGGGEGLAESDRAIIELEVRVGKFQKRADEQFRRSDEALSGVRRTLAGRDSDMLSAARVLSDLSSQIATKDGDSSATDGGIEMTQSGQNNSQIAGGSGNSTTGVMSEAPRLSLATSGDPRGHNRSSASAARVLSDTQSQSDARATLIRESPTISGSVGSDEDAKIGDNSDTGAAEIFDMALGEFGGGYGELSLDIDVLDIPCFEGSRNSPGAASGNSNPACQAPELAQKKEQTPAAPSLDTRGDSPSDNDSASGRDLDRDLLGDEPEDDFGDFGRTDGLLSPLGESSGVAESGVDSELRDQLESSLGRSPRSSSRDELEQASAKTTAAEKEKSATSAAHFLSVICVY